MNSLPIILRFGFGIGNTGQTAEERSGRIYRYEVQAEFVAEVLLNFFELVLAQHSVVDEDAGEQLARTIAHGAIDQHGRDRGIDAARERTNGTAILYLLANLFHGGVDEMLSRPGGLGGVQP